MSTSSPTSGTASKSGPVTITAQNADIFDQPREAILSGVHFEDEQKSRSMSAARMTILLRDDNTIEKALASEGISGSVSDAKGGTTEVHSSAAELFFGAQNNLKTAVDEGFCDYWAATMQGTPHIWSWHRRHDDQRRAERRLHVLGIDLSCSAQ